MVAADLEKLRLACLHPSLGDIRCIIYGHLIRLAIWRLRRGWDERRQTTEKLECIRKTVAKIAVPRQVEEFLTHPFSETRQQELMLEENIGAYGEPEELLTF